MSVLEVLLVQSRRVPADFRVLLPGGTSGEQSTCQCKRHKKCWFDPWVGKIPWRRKWQLTPVFLPGASPRTEEPGGLQSMGSHRVRRDWKDLACTRTVSGETEAGKERNKHGMQAVAAVAPAPSFLSCSQRRAEKAHPPFPPQPGALHRASLPGELCPWWSPELTFQAISPITLGPCCMPGPLLPLRPGFLSKLALLLLFICSVVSDSLRPHGLQKARLPCPSPSPRPYSNSCPLSR